MDPIDGMRCNKVYKEHFTSRLQWYNELFHLKKGATKTTLIPQSKLAIIDVSPANAIDEMMWNETYFGGSPSLPKKKRLVHMI